MVFDAAAGKDRDVDVTVTVQDESGIVTVFKAAEVKHEGQALDVGTIEQLCLKLADMPKVSRVESWRSSQMVLSPAPPHQTVRSVFPNTAFQSSSSRGFRFRLTFWHSFHRSSRNDWS